MNGRGPHVRPRALVDVASARNEVPRALRKSATRRRSGHEGMQLASKTSRHFRVEPVHLVEVTEDGPNPQSSTIRNALSRGAQISFSDQRKHRRDDGLSTRRRPEPTTVCTLALDRAFPCCRHRGLSLHRPVARRTYWHYRCHK